MNRSFRYAVALLGFAVAYLICLSLPISAHAADETMAAAVQQSDGIVDRVVDNLWDQVDVYWHNGDYNRIIALDRICVSADPSFTDCYSTGAWLMWSMGDSAAADAFLQDGLKYSSKRADISYEFAQQLFNTKRYTEAAKYLKMSIAAGQTSRLAYTMLAHSYRLSKKYDDSIAEWKLIMTKFPSFGAAKPNLERVEALKRGEPDTVRPNVSAPPTGKS